MLGGYGVAIAGSAARGDQERLLLRMTSDYAEYTDKVEYRLLPHIW